MERSISCFCLLLVYCLCPVVSVAQYPSYTNFTIDDGLSSNKIYTIIEDRYGFIWIGTDHGVSKYDGVEFTNFTTKNGLSDNEVLGLFEDAAGRIWFNGFSAEPCYYLNGKIYNADNDSLLRRVKRGKPPGPGTTFIVQNNKSMAFLIEEKGQTLIVGKNIPSSQLKSIQKPFSSFFQNNLIMDGDTWYSISGSYHYYWQQGDSLQMLDLKVPAPLSMNYVQAPPSQTLCGLDAVRHELWIFNPITRKVYQQQTGSEFVNLFSVDNIHILTSDSGYAIYDSSFTNILETAELPFDIERAYIDRKGNKWLGSFDHGIYLIRRSAPFKIELPGGTATAIRGISKLNNDLLLQTEKKGLIRLNEAGCDRVFYLKNMGRVMGYASIGEQHLVGADGGFYRLGKNFATQELIYQAAVKDIERGGENEILIGTSANAFRYLYGGAREEIFVLDSSRATAICRISDTEIWVGSLKGMRRFVQEGDDFKKEPIHLHPLLDEGRIVDIRCDRGGNVWVATDQKGIFCCTKDRGVIHFSEHLEGNAKIISDMCLQVEIDMEGAVWVTTTDGISVISSSSTSSKPGFSVLNYSLTDGMPGKTITAVAFLGEDIFVSTPHDLFRFTKFPQPSNETSQTVITGIEVNGATIDSGDLVLPYDQNNLIISYASSFINTHVTHSFAYRIKELGLDWIETNTLHVPLLGLEPGSYTFEIKSINVHGESGETAEVRFTILTPWFLRWWFLFPVIAVALFSVVYYYKLSRDRITMGRNMSLLKLRILRAQINPHFVFNALSNIQRLIQTGSSDRANGYIQTLSQIMRKSIEYSAQEFIQLSREIDYCKSYLDIEKMRYGERFDVSFDVLIEPGELSSIYVPPLIMQPILENTIKHAFRGIDHKGKLTVTVEKASEHLLRYIIRDNGKGFDTSKTVLKNYGLGITSERIDLLYKNMKVKGGMKIISSFEAPDTGTTVTIELPILRD